MKQLYRLLVTVMLTGSFFSSANAGTVTINFVDTSTWNQCGPIPFLAFIDYNASGYIAGDSVDIYINFGDGSDTLFKEGVNAGFGIGFHDYTLPGTFSVQYIVTGPDLAADTVIVYNQVTVGTNCGNITGTVYNDVNANCIIDGGEALLGNVLLTLYQNNIPVSWSMTDTNGYYDFYVPNGVYVVEVGNNGNGFSPVCPAINTINVPSVPSNNNNFGLGCAPGFDLTGTLWGWALRPGESRPFWLEVKNLRCLPTSGQAIVILDPRVSLDTAYTNPPTVIGDSLVWNFSNLSSLNPNNFNSYISLYSDTTLLDSLIYFTLIIEPIAGDQDQSNNVDTLCFWNENSWDPNEKEVLPRGLGLPGFVEANLEMEYTIHFQNTGTAEAYNIYLIDTIDSDLDLSTFNIISSSHSMQTIMLADNGIRFSFDDIHLPDSTTNEPGSHGFVKYSIMQQPNLTEGTEMTNTAHIFFDYNPAVVTNTTLNTIQFAASVKPVLVENTTATMKLYPNPAKEMLWIQLAKNTPAGAITVYDVHGRVVASIPFETSRVQLDISHYAPGLYMMVNESMPGQSSKLLISK